MRRLALLLLAACAPSARADMGPKPFMEFQLVYRIPGAPKAIDGEHRLCADQACEKFEPLRRYGPQRFACEGHACFSMAYGYDADYHRLVVRFADKTRTSNVFFNNNFLSTYTVFVRADDLVVEKLDGHDLRNHTWGPKLTEEVMVKNLDHSYGLNYALMFKWSVEPYERYIRHELFARFLVALALTLLIELTAAYAAFRRFARRRRLLLTVLAMNLITVPMVWLYCVAGQPADYRAGLIAAEIGAFLFEGLVLFLFNRDSLSIFQALGYSAVFNFLSYFGGELLTWHLPSWIYDKMVLWHWTRWSRPDKNVVP